MFPETMFRIEKIAELEYYTEGPVSENGNIYFTTLSGGSIMKIDQQGHLSEWARSSCPNGQAICADGSHLICDSRLGKVIRFDSDGKFPEDIIDCYCAGIRSECPNDIITDDEGNIFFTNSIRNEGSVFLIKPDGTQHQLISSLDYPNGLVLSGDHKFLYLSESYRNRVLRAELDNNSRVLTVSVFAELPEHSSGLKEKNLPDGLAVDQKGNLYIAHYGMSGIQRISASGQLLSFIDTGVPLTSNIIFIQDSIIVTGGYGEPGPGVVLKIYV